MNWLKAIAAHSQSINSPAQRVKSGQFWLNFGLGLLLAIAPGLAPMPALAQDVQVEPATFPVRFYCSRSRRGTSITYAETAQKTVVFIEWQRALSRNLEFDFYRHCQGASDRLQTYASQGQLNYITVGRMNGERVVCVAPRYEGGCEGLLWILRAGEDAYEALIRAFNVPRPSTYYDTSWRPRYLSVREILSRAPLAEENLAPEVKVEKMKPGRSRQLRASWGGNDGQNPNLAQGGKAWYFEKPEFFYTADRGCYLGGRSSGTLIQNNQQLRGTIRTLWEGENAETLVTGTIEGDRIQLRYERGFEVVMAGRLQEGVFRGTAIGCGGLRGEFAVAPMEQESPSSAPANGGEWGPPAGDRPGSGNFW